MVATIGVSVGVALIVWMFVHLRRGIQRDYHPGKVILSILAAAIYLAVMLVLFWLLYVASGTPLGIVAPILLAVVVNYGLTRAVMNYIARRYEGCDNPNEQYKSMRFRYSDMVLAAMTGAGAYGQHQIGVVVTTQWLLVCFAISAILMWVMHKIDSKNYNSVKGSPGTTLTKCYYDFMAHGVFQGLAMATWFTYFAVFLYCLIAQSATGVLTLGCVFVGLVLLAAIGLICLKPRPLDYTTAHSAVATNRKDAFWDGKFWHWALGVATMIAVVIVCYQVTGMSLASTLI